MSESVTGQRYENIGGLAAGVAQMIVDGVL